MSVQDVVGFMYKQLNLKWFFAVSLLLHVIFFVKYENQNVIDVNSSSDSLNIVISKKIVQLHFSESAKPGNTKDNDTENKKSYKETSKPRIEDYVNHSRGEVVKKSANDSNLNAISNNNLDVKKQRKKNIVQPEKTIQQKTNKQNNYIKEILLEIEKNKFYPALARRRNMQEVIPVSFTLLESGEVMNVVTTGRYKILRHAAKSAILNALPFTTPPSEMRLPFKVKYLMAFNLE